MIQDQSSAIEQSLSQIVDMLLLNGTLTTCPGLVHGKMGIAVFFFHYARYSDNMLFTDYALDLIEEIQEQLHANSLADYEKGIAGIGVGIDYLILNEFLDTEDDIFEDFDQRMVRAVMYDSWPDFSQYDGLVGYGRYWITRLRHQASSLQARECLFRIIERIEEKLPDISIKEQTDVYCFLHDLQEITGFDSCTEIREQCRKWDLQSEDSSRCFPRLSNSVIGNIIRMYQCNHYFNGALQGEIDLALKRIPDLDMEKPPVSMGFLTGYAGEGLLRLTALRQTNNSWMFLL
ncbi:MAG: hypothetical protein LBU37_06985 [Tannerellaceae bacterium]|jgi:hypothetical protein|nr:hypothetical protein [Tannerellaceae bacterium]